MPCDVIIQYNYDSTLAVVIIIHPPQGAMVEGESCAANVDQARGPRSSVVGPSMSLAVVDPSMRSWTDQRHYYSLACDPAENRVIIARTRTIVLVIIIR